MDGMMNQGSTVSPSVKMTSLVSGGSIWDYIEERHRKTSVFRNFLYTPESEAVIRPKFSVAALHVWEFYSEDYLAYGSTYDLGKNWWGYKKN